MPLAPLIASQCSGAYLALMLAALLRLLTVAALALMPLGMAAASATPAPVATGAEHCDDQGSRPSDNSSDRLAGCSAGCAMFIAEQAAAGEPVAAAAQLAGRPLAKRWTSLPAETATPPPKIA